MSLPHVLLGLLHDEPRTGYALARALREELDPCWTAGFSQIYPTLARLRRRGWVLLRVLGPRRGPRRLLYRVTASGRRELRRWLQEPPSPPRGNDEGLARLAFLDSLPLPDRRKALLAYEAALSGELARLRQLPLPAAIAGSRGERRSSSGRRCGVSSGAAGRARPRAKGSGSPPARNAETARQLDRDPDV